jgi:hypothetical protein
MYHADILLPKYFQNLILEDINLENELVLQKEIALPIEGGALLNVYTIINPWVKSKLII